MKRMILAAAVLSLAAPVAVAQEHYTEGPVWECSGYRTKQGHFDDYMTYLRQNLVAQMADGKKAGLFLDQKIFVHVPNSPEEPDVLICTLYASYGKALDFDAGDEAKSKEMAAKHFKTPDEKKQQEMTSKRFEMRDFMGTSYYREVNLKPMP
jgi:hypothetical protein